MADTKFMASALLALQLMTGGKGALAQEAPEPPPVEQTQVEAAAPPEGKQADLAEQKKAAAAAPTPEEIRRNKAREFLLDAARDDFLHVSRGAEDHYSRDLKRNSRQLTRYLHRAEGDKELGIVFLDPKKFDTGMALGMDADAVTKMMVNAQRTTVSDKVIEDAAEEMAAGWSSPLGIKTYTQNPSAHHDLYGSGAQSCVIVPVSAHHPDAFNIAGLTEKQNRELINRHEGWHCIDHRTTFAGMDKDKVDEAGTPENARALSILNRSETIADVGAAGDMVRSGMGTDLIDKLIVWRQDTTDLNHMSIGGLTALKAKIGEMGIDKFRRMSDKDARTLYEHLADDNGLTPGMAEVASAYQNATRSEKEEFRIKLRDEPDEVLTEAPEAAKALAFLKFYPSHVVPGFTYAENAEYSRLRDARGDATTKYNTDGLDPAKMQDFDVSDFEAIKGDEEYQKAVSILNGKEAFADVAAAGDLIRKGTDPTRVVNGLLVHNIAEIGNLTEASAPALLAFHAKVQEMGVENFRKMTPEQSEKFYEQIVDAHIMTPAMVKSVLEYADLTAAEQRKATQELSKPGTEHFADLKSSLDFIKAYPDTRVPAYSYQENIEFNRFRDARINAPGKFTQLPDDAMKALEEAHNGALELNVGKPERLAALTAEHRMETYGDVAAAGDMIRKGANATSVIDRLIELRAKGGDDIAHMSVAALQDLKHQVNEMGMAKFNKLNDSQVQQIYESTTERKTMTVGMTEMVIAYGAADADDRKAARRDATTEESRKDYPDFPAALAFMRDYPEPGLKNSIGIKKTSDHTVAQDRAAEQLEQWDALGALTDRAFKRYGKITPATLVDAYGDLQEGLRRQFEKDPANPLYKEQMNKLQQAFVGNVQEIDYIEANRSRGVDIVKKERGLAEALGEKPATRIAARNTPQPAT